ncbi:hypothetical protein EVAR_45481_1 [Eumeta japonica]|uniref:Uncharacterized protein n=1 Tax=Eumeta variegata TaxID=151549 RepID=A0A4C1WHA3_EUMVA|nr:hypothetical protein EVAR_45481_1 [Eumeta japonica]
MRKSCVVVTIYNKIPNSLKLCVRPLTAHEGADLLDTDCRRLPRANLECGMGLKTFRRAPPRGRESATNSRNGVKGMRPSWREMHTVT